MELHLVENLAARLIEGLQSGDLDLAVISLALAFPDVVCSELFREELLLVLPSSHPLADLPRLDPRRIAGEYLLVLRQGHCFRKDALAVCRRVLREPGTVFESDQFSSIFCIGCERVWNQRSASDGDSTCRRVPSGSHYRRPVTPNRLRADPASL